MKSLFLVETPFQVESALTIISKDRLTNYEFVVLLNGNPLNDEKVKRLLTGHSAQLTVIRNDKAKKLKLVPFLLCLFARYLGRCEDVYIGDPNNSWMFVLSKVIAKGVIYIIDDGLLTVTKYQQLLQNNPKNKTTFYTRFPLKNLPDKNIHIKRLYLTRVSKVLKSEMFVVGGALSRNSLMPENTYTDLLVEVVRKNKNLRCIFIPHRYESPSVIELMKSVCEVKHLSTSIEEYLGSKDAIPTKYASFVSTALFNISEMYVGVEVEAVCVLKYLTEKDASHYGHTYDFFENYCKNIRILR